MPFALQLNSLYDAQRVAFVVADTQDAEGALSTYHALVMNRALLRLAQINADAYWAKKVLQQGECKNLHLCRDFIEELKQELNPNQEGI